MFKKQYIYGFLFTLLGGLSSCSMEDIDLPSGFSSDGEVAITLSVPEMEVIETRSATQEDNISSATILVMDKAGADMVVKQVIPFSNLSVTNGQCTLRGQLKKEIRNSSNLSFYVFTNLPSGVSFAEGNKEKDDVWVQVSNILNTSKTDPEMVMSGYATKAQILSGQTIPVYRNAAKVVVGNPKVGDSQSIGDTQYDFKVFGTAAKARAVAPSWISYKSYLFKAEEATVPATLTPDVEPYYNPTENKGRDSKIRPFIIAKIPYGGITENYYRIEFEKYDKVTKEFTTLDLLPNYEYRVIISGVKGKGDATPAAAAKNPLTAADLLEFEVIDYAPQSYNMISDGIRELGVTAELRHNGESTVDGDPEYAYVKLYSPDSSDYPSTADAAEFQEYWKQALTPSDGWMKIRNVEDITATAYNDAATGVSADFKGRVYKVAIDFTKSSTTDDDEGVITAYWKGLTRDIKVMWTREFDPSELCSVKASIKSGSSVKYPDGGGTFDYWDFIENKCLGITPAQNNGKVRDEGLHFPINYGGDTNPWTYEYEIEYIDLNNGFGYSWECSAVSEDGESVLTSYLLNNQPGTASGTVGNGGKVKFTVTRPGNDWKYEVGKLRLSIWTKADKSDLAVYDQIQLYHTGFFDNPYLFRDDKTNHRVDITGNDDNFYYYEVRQGEDNDGQPLYWLDRNLGATSAAYYIQSSNGGGITYYGESEAAGGYYKIGKEKDYTGYEPGGDNYKDPFGTCDMYRNICPPGFEIPRTSAWNTLRNSTSFSTSMEGTYYKARFRVPGTNDYIYFPRARYYEGDSKVGESRAGYYWTSSPSEGLEKEHVGRWMKYLKFSGGITSYDNSDVKTDAMPIRCVSTSNHSNEENPNRTNINVIGATHVLLYSIVNGKKKAVTNWPGQAIGNYLTMALPDSEDKYRYFNFVYNSPNTPPESFYVLFTFRTEDGIWHTFSKDGNNTKVSTNSKFEDLTGWKIVGTWKDKGGNAIATECGGYWVCDLDNGKVYYNPKTYTPPTEPDLPPLPEKKTYRLYWVRGVDWVNREWICGWDNSSSIPFNCKANYIDESGNYCYYEWQEDQDKQFSFKLRFCADNNWGEETGEKYFNQDSFILNSGTGCYENKDNISGY